MSDVSWDKNDMSFMQEAIEEAKLALKEGEVPVGCVLVDKQSQRIISRGHNKVNISCNPTRHAEFEALGQLAENAEGVDLCLYVTCEPCGMCAAALRFAGIFDIIYGCKNERFGGCGTVTPTGTMPLFTHPTKHSSISPISSLFVRNGLFSEEAISLLQDFYRQENALAPPEKRKRKQ